MPTIAVRQDLCAKDGLCIDVCPLGLLARSSEGLPVTSAERAAQCIECGHCVAVCPHAALVLGDIRPEQLEPLSSSTLPSPEALDALLRGRRSIRRYRDEELARDELQSLLDVTRHAPTGKNCQPLRWTVVSGMSQVGELAGICADFFRRMLDAEPEKAKALGAKRLVSAWDEGIDEILRSAPHVFVAHGPTSQSMVAGSATIALEYLELAAYSRGLGTCWAGFLHIAALYYPPLAAHLKLPVGDGVAGAMMLGRPKARYRRVPPRKPLDVTWL